MTLLAPNTETDSAPMFTAVTYQRVSTKEQAAKGGRDEGFSIPAQREANARKAESLGARVVAEFVDAGESARSADRPDLQRMLEYIATHQVSYCIVHKVDRLARNRVDDVEIHRRLVEAGVTLVSATENIDETPSGMLLHGIMSSIAEFYSKNLATEVTKGLTQKFETGGTPMRAPIGYLNVRKRDEQGREYRTVEIDPERAPLIRWVFEQYATGDRTVVDLLAEVTARGLTTVPTPKRPSGPMARSGFFKILRNPYYIGIVRYKGAEQPGTHEPLIDIDTWQHVQRLLDSRKIASERRRSHDHYLKGTLYCGSCGSRMQLDYPANKQGVRYGYYVCSGRASKRKNCTRRAVPIGVAEQLVADCYQDIAITEADYTALAAQVEAAFDERLASRSQELAELTENRQRLQNESDKLLAAHFADAIDLKTLKRHQDRIRTGLADIDRRLASVSPPPAIEKALLCAMALAKASVPPANWSNSNTPTGPFHTMVPAALSSPASAAADCGPISRIMSSAATSSTDLTVALASAANSEATTTSVGSGTTPPLAAILAMIFFASSTKSCSASDLPMGLPSASKKVLAMPPPTMS